MATVLEKVHKLTYVENFAMALYQVFTSIKISMISEYLVLLTQNEQFRAKSAHIRPTTRRREFYKASHKASVVGMAVPESKHSPTFPAMSASGVSPLMRVSC